MITTIDSTQGLVSMQITNMGFNSSNIGGRADWPFTQTQNNSKYLSYRIDTGVYTYFEQIANNDLNITSKYWMRYSMCALTTSETDIASFNSNVYYIGVSTTDLSSNSSFAFVWDPKTSTISTTMGTVNLKARTFTPTGPSPFTNVTTSIGVGTLNCNTIDCSFDLFSSTPTIEMYINNVLVYRASAPSSIGVTKVSDVAPVCTTASKLVIICGMMLANFETFNHIRIGSTEHSSSRYRPFIVPTTIIESYQYVKGIEVSAGMSGDYGSYNNSWTYSVTSNNKTVVIGTGMGSTASGSTTMSAGWVSKLLTTNPVTKTPWLPSDGASTMFIGSLTRPPRSAYTSTMLAAVVAGPVDVAPYIGRRSTFVTTGV